MKGYFFNFSTSLSPIFRYFHSIFRGFSEQTFQSYGKTLMIRSIFVFAVSMPTKLLCYTTFFPHHTFFIILLIKIYVFYLVP